MRFLVIGSLSLVCWVGTATAASTASSPTISLPDFMESWEFGANIDEDQGPSYFGDFILPLYRHPDDDHVVFLEPRVSYADSEYLFNLGTGFRKLFLNRSWILGTNMFYDYDTSHAHYRLGWGAEALSQYAEFRFNYYLGLSGKRRIEETGTTSTFEKAVNGYDVEIGAPVPYYSRLKLFGGYEWYNFEQFKNRYGWRLRAEYTPIPFIVIDGTVSNSTKSNVDWGMTLAVRIPLGHNIEPPHKRPWQPDDTAFPKSDMSRGMWKLVERRHEIVLEKWTETGSVSVEVTRGN